MPFCPNCKYEYLPGNTTCPDCGEKLVDSLSEETFLSEEDWEVVYTSSFDFEVEMLKSNLESAGITANILSQRDSNFPAPGDLSIIKLLVKKDDVVNALAFIEEFKKNLKTQDEGDSEIE
jgi:hypothetical protein